MENLTDFPCTAARDLVLWLHWQFHY